MLSWRLATVDQRAAAARASLSSCASSRSSRRSHASFSRASAGNSSARSWRTRASCASELHCLRCCCQRLLRDLFSSFVRRVTSLSRQWRRLRASLTCVRSMVLKGPSSFLTRLGLGGGAGSRGGSSAGSWLSTNRASSHWAASGMTSVCTAASMHDGLGGAASAAEAGSGADPWRRSCGGAADTFSRSWLTWASSAAKRTAAFGGRKASWISALNRLLSAVPACSHGAPSGSPSSAPAPDSGTLASE
mmetsp:Transcript_38138/g.106163  ORF Transcript_38138/g.106163 Transcript_38138/m.106163 type:complete len:248 (+) Transcript_38138:806-1549(+)